jgi:hypothetical protein
MDGVKDLSYRMKLVQETIDNKNYEQFKKEALELAESITSQCGIPKEILETKSNSADTTRLQNEQFKNKIAKKYGVEVE